MIRIIRFTSVLQIIEIDIYQHYRIVYQNYQQQKKKKKRKMLVIINILQKFVDDFVIINMQDQTADFHEFMENL